MYTKELLQEWILGIEGVTASGAPDKPAWPSLLIWLLTQLPPLCLAATWASVLMRIATCQWQLSVGKGCSLWSSLASIMTVAVPSLTLASRLSPYPLGEQLAALCGSPSECWPISSFRQGTDLGSDLLTLPVSPRLSPHLDFTLHSLPSPGTVLPATTLP